MSEELKQDVLNDRRLEWIDPSIDDFDIEEVTHSAFNNSGTDNGSYS